MSDFVRFSLRIPVDVHENLKKLAEHDRRSLNTYIVMALEDHVTQNIKKLPLEGQVDLFETDIDQIK